MFSGAAVRGSALSLLLVFSLVFAQAVSLNHSHDSDLPEQVDCEICLKVSADDDVLTGGSELLAVVNTQSVSLSSFPAPVTIAAEAASARAPPQA